MYTVYPEIIAKVDIRKRQGLRAIKDWVHGFWDYFMANFGSTLLQLKKLELFTTVTCSSTLNVYFWCHIVCSERVPVTYSTSIDNTVRSMYCIITTYCIIYGIYEEQKNYRRSSPLKSPSVYTDNW